MPYHHIQKHVPWPLVLWFENGFHHCLKKKKKKKLQNLLSENIIWKWPSGTLRLVEGDKFGKSKDFPTRTYPAPCWYSLTVLIVDASLSLTADSKWIPYGFFLACWSCCTFPALICQDVLIFPPFDSPARQQTYINRIKSSDYLKMSIDSEGYLLNNTAAFSIIRFSVWLWRINGSFENQLVNWLLNSNTNHQKLPSGILRKWSKHTWIFQETKSENRVFENVWGFPFFMQVATIKLYIDSSLLYNLVYHHNRLFGVAVKLSPWGFFTPVT